MLTVSQLYIYGGFLGAVAVSYFTVLNGRGFKKSVSGRSKCDHCEKILKFYELVPIFSWVFNLGKCSSCKEPISSNYVVSEIIGTLAGLTIVKVFLTFSLLESLLLSLSIGIALFIAVYDLDRKIIPNPLVVMLTIIWIVYFLLFLDFSSLLSVFLWSALASLLVFAPWLLTKGRGMGFGDVKLMFVLGLFLGADALSMSVLSFWIGALVGLILMTQKEKFNMKSSIPFGPFIVVAYLITLLGFVPITKLIL